MKAGTHHGLDVRIDHVENPRVEKEEHYYNAKHTKLLDLGLEPRLLSETLVESMFDAIAKHRDRVRMDHILPRTRWHPATLKTPPSRPRPSRRRRRGAGR